MMTSLGTYHPFQSRPTYRKLADLPLAERAAEMRRPEVREQILADPDEISGGLGALLAVMLGRGVGRMFSMAAPVDYEPDPSSSVKAQAKALGKEPLDHLYDLLTEGDGSTFYAILGSNFGDGTLEPCREMLLDPHTVSGLSDAGAHVTMISDCSTSTFHLTHWVRDRHKGDRVPLELAVHKLTGAPAGMYGFTDRGVLAEGTRADLNVIDLDNLTIQAPVHPPRPAHRSQPDPAAVDRLPRHHGQRRARAAPRRGHRRPPGPPAPQRTGGELMDDRRHIVVVGAGHRRARLGPGPRPRRSPRHRHRTGRHPDARRRRGRLRVEPERRTPGAAPARLPRPRPHDPARPLPRCAPGAHRRRRAHRAHGRRASRCP